MKPSIWADDPVKHHAAALAGSAALTDALIAAGGAVETIPGVAGLPDMVFPANAAVVLDRRAIVARFARPERQGEETPYREALEAFVEKGLLDEVAAFPDEVFQEGAGDAIWDAGRALFWAGHGQRSTRAAIGALERFFGRTMVPLELATPRFYHLDTCFCPLSGGEVLYYPPAFTEQSRREIEARLPPDQRLVADEADAAAFAVNAVNIGRKVIMARPPAHARHLLEARGYEVVAVDLDPFILSGGGAYCMTLRLDRQSAAG